MSSLNQSVSNDKNDNSKKIGSKLDFDLLPTIFNRIVKCYDDENDKLMMLLGAITVSSCVLPNVYGLYGEQKLYPNLYFYLIGKASSGKGKLNRLRKLVDSVQNSQANNLSILNQLIESQTNSQLKQLVISGNITSAALIQQLNINNGVGIIFETEGDTISSAFKSEHGKFSDSLRKAFHHETISSQRKGNDGKGENIIIKEPKLSMLITSTPNQFKTLIPDSENGLFSRFMFLGVNRWKS